MNSNIAKYLLIPVFFPIFSLQSIGQPQAKMISAEIANAKREKVETRDLKVWNLDLGLLVTGNNKFSAVVKNKSKSPLVVGLDLATQPGLWIRGRFQKQFYFDVRPNEKKQIEAIYEFKKVTPEAALIVRIGVAVTKENGAYEIKDFILDKKYNVGQGNRAVDYDASNFKKHETEKFDIYTYKGSLAEQQLSQIIAKRETAFREISNILAVSYDRKIRLVFYPDEETKIKDIGHTGYGYAFSNNIVEVYNEKIKLDPFHELTHIIAGRLGYPPALFNEGFAVYTSEKLGADALKHLGWPGKTVDQASAHLAKEGKLIELVKLFEFVEIGSEESNWQVSYPQAASIVKYLIEVHGAERFRSAYQRLQISKEHERITKNVEVFTEIYGISLREIEREWLRKISASK